MKYTKWSIGLNLCLCLLFCTACAGYHKEKGLKDTFLDYFLVGVAIHPGNLNPTEEELIRAEFNSVTCENAMKPAVLHPSPDEWNFAAADSIADWCRASGIRMRGHCLCWHNQFAEWMLYDDGGQIVDKEIFYQRLRAHIHAVVSRYKDVVYCWDVVNEAIVDDVPEDGNPYRQSFLYDLCGDEFIEKAFLFAAEADPDALLFYNDYNTFEPGKRDRIAAMVRRMKNRGVRIDGIGMQGHCNLLWPEADDLAAAIDTFASIVDHVQITELDVRVNNDFGGQLMFSTDTVALSDSVLEAHTRQYARVFEVLRNHHKQIDVVTFWNLSDKDSWVGTANYPLLFDANLQRKPVYNYITSF